MKLKKYLEDKGIYIPWFIIKNICRTISREKKDCKFSYDEIYRLREQGLSYKKIKEKFKEKGIEVSTSAIRNKCKNIYEYKEKKEPIIKHKINKKIKLPEEEIYNLREQYLSYDEIAKQFKNKGIDVSAITINDRCKSIYKEKGKEEPKVSKRKRISEEEVYNLREQRLSYEEIAKRFKNKGIDVSVTIISNRCKEVYKKKGKEVPKCKYKKHSKHKSGNRIKISDEDIFNLREQRLSYNQIAKRFNEMGTKVSGMTVMDR